MYATLRRFSKAAGCGTIRAAGECSLASLPLDLRRRRALVDIVYSRFAGGLRSDGDGSLREFHSFRRTGGVAGCWQALLLAVGAVTGWHRRRRCRTGAIFLQFVSGRQDGHHPLPVADRRPVSGMSGS